MYFKVVHNCTSPNLITFQSMKIAESIAGCDINNVDRLLKKDLIFIMQVSQKPRTIAFTGFLTFDLGAFTIVSYMAGLPFLKSKFLFFLTFV